MENVDFIALIREVFSYSRIGLLFAFKSYPFTLRVTSRLFPAKFDNYGAWFYRRRRQWQLRHIW